MKGHTRDAELLSPAGDWASLSAAIDAGADAVYFGVKGMNMRDAAGNFQINELDRVMSVLKKSGKKGYLALNTVMMNADLERARRIVQKARAAGVDALILWDTAVLQMAREAGLPVHISTQASVANLDAVKFYAALGAERIVLARECTLQDIRQIIRGLKEDGLACRIETFIHGAMCVSVSGRCFLSQETFGESANKGKCLQPCRREYEIRDLDGECAYRVGQDYILSPKDLCAIDFIDQMIASGITAFKIEGRMRSPEYVRIVTSCYRRVIDACLAGKLTEDLKHSCKEELAAVYNRGFSDGFFFGRPDARAWSRGLEHTREKVFIGEVTRFFKKISVAEVRLRTGRICKGEELLFIGKTTPAEQTRIEEMQKDGCFIDRAQKGDVVGLKVPFLLRPRDKVFLWKERE